MNSVTELADAMAGASTPVLRLDCCSANPVSADRIRTQTDQLLSSDRTPPPTSVTKVLVTAAWSPKPSPAAAPKVSAFAAPRKRTPTMTRATTSTAIVTQAIHQDAALGWLVPPWGWPAVMKKMIPTMVSSAPANSRRPRC